MKELKNVLLNKEEIQAKIKEMGEQISKDYAGKEVLVIIVLRGAIFFAMDLIKYLDLDLTFDFIQVSSYGAGTESSGKVLLKKDIEENIEGRHVLIIEDIIDTGLTMQYLKEYLRKKNPASLKSAILVSKPSRRVIEVPVDYIGFEIPNHYIVGYGFDKDNHYRNLPYIACWDAAEE